MQDVQDGEKQAHDHQVKIGDLQSLFEFLRRSGDKAAKDRPPRKEHEDGDQDRGCKGNEYGGSHSFPDAVRSVCAKVLPHIGDHGIAV